MGWTLNMKNYGAFFVLAWIVASANGQCTFPSALQGTWMTSSNGNITIGSSTITNYPVTIYGNFDFDCTELYGGRYVTKSQTLLSTSGLTLYIYLCLDFTAISSNLYYYYLGSNMTAGIEAVFRAQWSPPTAADVCAKTADQYDKALFQVMIKNGDGVAAKTACPTDIQSSWNYELDSGSGNTCNPGGELEACTGSQLSVNYTVCPSRAFYSSGGLVYCLASISSGTRTYLAVYNPDPTVDNTNTYRLACLVFERSGSTGFMTQYPGACQSTQTPINVATPTGSLFTLTNGTACPVVTSSESNLLYIVLGLVGALLIVCVVAIVIFVFCNWKAKQRPFRGKLEPEEPGEKTGRLQAFENGFKRIKHPGELDKPLDRDGTPEHDEDTPINVMHLLRKDVITPGGRESPASHVILSVSTPNPYSFHDGDSVGGSSLPIPHENPALKKHYHVIGGEPSVGYVEEEDEDNLQDEPDGNTSKLPARLSAGKRLGSGHRLGSGRRAGSARSNHTPVMVMPVRSDGSDAFDGDGDDVSDDALFETDEEHVVASARLGVGINELGMCPPPRLPPIDEGPASHRSMTGAGNKKMGKRRKLAAAGATTAKQTVPTIGEENPCFAEDGEEEAPSTARQNGKNSDPLSSGECMTSSEDKGGYNMAGDLTVSMPDVVEEVDMGTGTVEDHAGARWAYDASTAREDQDHLRPSTLSAREDRCSSLLQSATSTSADSRPRAQGKSKSQRKKKYTDNEEVRPQSRVKVTRVDIPELLPPGETEIAPPGENELVQSPGLSFRNAAYQFDLEEVKVEGAGGGRGGGGGGRRASSSAAAVEAGEGRAEGSTNDGTTPRRLWLKPKTGTENIYNQVSHMWRRIHRWNNSAASTANASTATASTATANAAAAGGGSTAVPGVETAPNSARPSDGTTAGV